MARDSGPHSLSDLIARLRAGDATALRELMDRHYTQFVRVAAIYTRSIDIAEDVVQSVLIGIWDRREMLPPADELMPYLITAIRNQAVSQYRSHHTRQRYHNSASREEAQSRMVVNDAVERLATEELQVRLEREIASLPPRCQEVFRLSREGGLAYQEIGAVLGISTNTVRGQIAKALEILRRDLGGWIAD